MFSSFRFGIPAVYGEVGGPQIRGRTPAPLTPPPTVAYNNPPTDAAVAVPIQHVPNNDNNNVDHNDGGNVRNSLLYFFHSYYPFMRTL